MSISTLRSKNVWLDVSIVMVSATRSSNLAAAAAAAQVGEAYF